MCVHMYVLTCVTHCVCRAALSAVSASLTYCPHFLPDVIIMWGGERGDSTLLHCICMHRCLHKRSLV